MKNIFYCPHINAIGGIETYLYQIALKYGGKYDITIMYKSGDANQILRYMQHVRCVKWDGKTRFSCEKLFTGYTTDIAHFIDYKELYIVIHADFFTQKLTFPPEVPKDARYLCVSEAIRKSNEEWLKVPMALAYNPIVIPDEKRALRLISATRLTREKGRFRMEQLAKALHQANVPFVWTIFSDDLSPFGDPCMVVLPPILDILPYIRSSDYLVQLSDTEAYSYSILEALCVGTGVIVTPLPMVEEAGIKNGVNGFVLPFDMKEIPVEEIAKGLPKFDYTPHPDRYEELLAPGKPSFDTDKDRIVEVTHLINYFDLELQENVIAGRTHTTKYPRAAMLEAKGFVIITGDG